MAGEERSVWQVEIKREEARSGSAGVARMETKGGESPALKWRGRNVPDRMASCGVAGWDRIDQVRTVWSEGEWQDRKVIACSGEIRNCRKGNAGLGLKGRGVGSQSRRGGRRRVLDGLGL